MTPKQRRRMEERIEREAVARRRQEATALQRQRLDLLAKRARRNRHRKALLRRWFTTLNLAQQTAIQNAWLQLQARP